MKNLKTQFTQIASVAALALGLVGINQMASYSDPASTYTYVGSSSWASNGSGITLFSVRAQGTSSQASGYIGCSGHDYTAIGSAQSVADSVAEDGSETAVVTGKVRVYTLIRTPGHITLGSYVAGQATFTCVVGADGSQTESVEIVDSSGHTLAHVPLEPVVRGSVEIFH